ncbi:MAG TPA: glycine zipper 2TM domain-containing protein [Acetobacteraceae bacterium]|nr:glycine zipper 2TM domain-containing protein [Acetobacteraceae bacterium]
MKKISIFVTAALTFTQVSAHAFEAVANVVGVTPITEQVNHPTQQCWTETQQTTQAVPQQRNFLGAIIGGVAGGLLGAQVGRGNGRIAGAAVGAGVGALAGDAVANQNAGPGTVTTTTPVQRCRQVDNFQAVTTGYMVTYEYAGQRFSTRLPYNPGNQLRVNVAVTPR